MWMSTGSVSATTSEGRGRDETSGPRARRHLGEDHEEFAQIPESVIAQWKATFGPPATGLVGVRGAKSCRRTVAHG